jgi:hypothetical protein
VVIASILARPDRKSRASLEDLEDAPEGLAACPRLLEVARKSLEDAARRFQKSVRILERVASYIQAGSMYLKTAARCSWAGTRHL